MKFSKFGRIALASVISLGLGFGVIACGPPNTIDFLYVTSSKQDPGQINAYKVDSQAGALIPIPNSPYGSGGSNPVADVTSPNGKNLYVVNHDSNTIVVFTISTDGSLSKQQSCPTPGTFPAQLAINRAGTYLYVVETYQPSFNANTPGPGRWWSFPSTRPGNWAPRATRVPRSRMATTRSFPVGNKSSRGQCGGQQYLRLCSQRK